MKLLTTRLDGLDQAGMQDIICTLVRRIEIDEGHIDLFRVPPNSLSACRMAAKARKWRRGLSLDGCRAA
jgi:hypothetical protein